MLKAIVMSLSVITVLYLLVNFFYISILGTEVILNSSAVATDFATQILPQVSFLVPIMVACSCLGAALVQVIHVLYLTLISWYKNNNVMSKI